MHRQRQKWIYRTGKHYIKGEKGISVLLSPKGTQPIEGLGRERPQVLMTGM